MYNIDISYNKIILITTFFALCKSEKKEPKSNQFYKVLILNNLTVTFSDLKNYLK